MGQQQGVLIGSRHAATMADWDAKSTRSTSSIATKRFRQKLRKSLRMRPNRSCRELSATFQYHSNGGGSVFDQLNLNTASEDELMTLPGITRQTAQNIVNHRSLIGGFRKVQDLALVSGVGATLMERLRYDVCVSHGSSNDGRMGRNRPLTNYGSDSTHSLESLNGMSSPRFLSCAQVNVNSASMFDLMAVPGLTQELAAGICHLRDKKGRIKSIDALLKVKGMSSPRLELVRARLCVDDETSPVGATCLTNGKSSCGNGRNASSDGDPSTGSLGGHSGSSGSSSGSASRAPMTAASGLVPRGSPSVSLHSRRSRRAELNSAAGSADIFDYDIYKLIAHLAVRPIVSRTDPSAVSHSRVRIALWDLEQLSDDKASNLGVQEVVCRTLLENEISVLVCHDVTSPSAGARLTAELNQPLLSRVAAWEPQERRWHHVFPPQKETSTPTSAALSGQADKEPQATNDTRTLPNGEGPTKHDTVQDSGRSVNDSNVARTASVTPTTNTCLTSSTGLLYAAANGLRHLDYSFVKLRPDLAPALICHFEVGGSMHFSVVSVDLRGLGSSKNLGMALPSLVTRLAAELTFTGNVIVCGNFLTSPTDEALDELLRVGFHLLHPIASREHTLHEHLHIWCSSGARALCRNTSEAETIVNGLTHPMIPRGTWHWGGSVSSHKPVFIELGLPTANGAILAHGQQVLLNGMVSAD